MTKATLLLSRSLFGIGWRVFFSLILKHSTVLFLLFNRIDVFFFVSALTVMKKINIFLEPLCVLHPTKKKAFSIFLIHAFVLHQWFQVQFLFIVVLVFDIISIIINVFFFLWVETPKKLLRIITMNFIFPKSREKNLFYFRIMIQVYFTPICILLLLLFFLYDSVLHNNKTMHRELKSEQGRTETKRGFCFIFLI